MQAAILKEIEGQLLKSDTPFIEGDAPTSIDAKSFGMLQENKIVPTAKTHPYTFSWYNFITQFTPE